MSVVSELDPYPFESDDEHQITELDLESLDRFADRRITVGELFDEHESWRFGHVIVDEAQDLTPMQWRMVMRRVRGRSMTVVGDVAQRSTGPRRRWTQLLPPELADTDRMDLTINYRSPHEVNELATRILDVIAPDVTPPVAIRSSGFPPEIVSFGDDGDLATLVESLADDESGQTAVIAPDTVLDDGAEARAPEVPWLAPSDAKGLEFDTVLVVEPGLIWDQPGGPALLYVAITRATRRLVIAHASPLPAVLTT